MVVFGHLWLYSGKCGIGARVVVLGQKWLHLCKSGILRQMGCIRAEVVVLGQKWLYSGKVVVFGRCRCIHAKGLCSGKSGYKRVKFLYYKHFFPNTTYLNEYNYLKNTSTFARIQPSCPKTTTLPEYNHFCPNTTTFARLQPLCPNTITFSFFVVVFGKKWFYSVRNGFFRAKVDVFGQSSCFRAKWF